MEIKKNCPQRDYLVCTCMGVMYSDIMDEIRKGATTFNDLSSTLGVGTGCSSCVAEVHDIVRTCGIACSSQTKK